ncbi:MAG: DUF547 domain-containing protein [Gemmatimonadetes bacterium]|nr:DUF547 domain-containing protein [Gemmatimonadota bacterium]
MRSLYFLSSWLLVPVALCAAPPFDHGPFDQVLQEYVDDQGLVRYAALAQDRAQLDAYVDSLGLYSPETHPDRFPTREHELAYWINAYNAFTLRGVIDAYPIATVMDAFVSSGFFNRQTFSLGGSRRRFIIFKTKLSAQPTKIHASTLRSTARPSVVHNWKTGSLPVPISMPAWNGR